MAYLYKLKKKSEKKIKTKFTKSKNKKFLKFLFTEKVLYLYI